MVRVRDSFRLPGPPRPCFNGLSLRQTLTRRHFLGVGAVAAAGALMPVRAFAAGHTLAPDRALNFLHTHTGERLAAEYCSAGEYLPQALGSINCLLRDFRANARSEEHTSELQS